MQVLKGHRDAFDLIKRDQWFGGVHLRTDHRMWTWDADDKSLKVTEH